LTGRQQKHLLLLLFMLLVRAASSTGQLACCLCLLQWRAAGMPCGLLLVLLLVLPCGLLLPVCARGGTLPKDGPCCAAVAAAGCLGGGRGWQWTALLQR
jgi:hypothetical protein